MAELGLGSSDFAKLGKLEWSKLNQAGDSAVGKLVSRMGGGVAAMLKKLPGLAWGPSVEALSVRGQSVAAEAPELSKHIPLLIGSVTEEGFPLFLDPAESLSEAQWHASLVGRYGETRAGSLVQVMKRIHPEKSITKLAAGVAGLEVRNQIQRLIEQRQLQRAAPVYQYLFSWQSPQLEGRAGAWHTSELAFCFDQTERCAQGTGNTLGARSLAQKMAAAWVAFARTGNPATPELNWAATDAVSVQTMVFDDRCRMEKDPDGEARNILLAKS
jgi:para-nitrobenzyl esterase